MKASALFAAVLAPTLSLANVELEWRAPQGPADGLRDITFPMNIANAPHKKGFYFAQQFAMLNKDNGYRSAYIGLQPRDDVSKGPWFLAVFSSFTPGTKTNDPNCRQGADLKKGVSCAIAVPSDYKATYNFVVENVGGTTWNGTVVDTTTSKAVHIGSWTLPAGSKGIKTREGRAWTEYFPFNQAKNRPPKCASLPKTQVTFGNPTTKTPGAGKLVLTWPSEYGDCSKKQGLTRSITKDGFQLDLGFD
ncbi:hypothetical protein HIM_00178 [Hirsutella minnesotensis 3608]|nr:hypothetical protein HIM_00178 [Hirsutella minnesotensis 3608]